MNCRLVASRLVVFPLSGRISGTRFYQDKVDQRVVGSWCIVFSMLNSDDCITMNSHGFMLTLTVCEIGQETSDEIHSHLITIDWSIIHFFSATRLYAWQATFPSWTKQTIIFNKYLTIDKAPTKMHYRIIICSIYRNWFVSQQTNTTCSIYMHRCFVSLTPWYKQLQGMDRSFSSTHVWMVESLVCVK